MKQLVNVYVEETEKDLNELNCSYHTKLQDNPSVKPSSVKFDERYRIIVDMKNGNSYINDITKERNKARLEIICTDSKDNSQFNQDSKVFKNVFERVANGKVV